MDSDADPLEKVGNNKLISDDKSDGLKLASAVCVRSRVDESKNSAEDDSERAVE
jgi:hypothetical protein